ncbi:MAG: glycosyltransferase [Aigarchaeota archaeon]|nr:glycosyltransferase [Aigarchaeota archaeon]MDW8092651.1 glycosyltransferase [Nitrososphaerota archaeon]
MVSAFPPDKGRLSEYAAALIGELIKNYDNIRVEILSDSGSHQSDRITVKTSWRADDVISVLKLWTRIISSKVKLVHFNLHMAVFGRGRVVNFFGLLSVFIARMSGKKVITTLHNIPAGIRLESVGIIANTIVNRIGLWLATVLVVKSSHVTVVKMKSYTSIVEQLYGAKRVVWIPHGAWFTDKQPTWRYSGKGNILFLGYITPYKDLHALIKAVKRIAEKSKVKLLISGDVHPNFREEGQKLLESIKDDPCVLFLGYVPDNALPELIKEIDVVVLPYRTSTGTSGVVHVLSALGCPFVVSDTPEFRELEREGAGFLVTPLEPNRLSESIERILSNPDLAHELSWKSVKFAHSRSWQNVAKAYMQLYSELIKN